MFSKVLAEDDGVGEWKLAHAPAVDCINLTLSKQTRLFPKHNILLQILLFFPPIPM